MTPQMNITTPEIVRQIDLPNPTHQENHYWYKQHARHDWKMHAQSVVPRTCSCFPASSGVASEEEAQAQTAPSAAPHKP